MHSGLVGVSAAADYNAMMMQEHTAMRWGATGTDASVMTPMQAAAAAAAVATTQLPMAMPLVTMQMLQCVMCANQFSTSGKLSDLKTPVLAVNPSSSIEGPYCIACAGKREGLRSFQIDEARVILVKLMHHHINQQQQQQQQQQQNLSTGAAFAYAALHHQLTLPTVIGINSTNSNSSTVSNGSNGSHHAPQPSSQHQPKKDAPGSTSAVTAPGTRTVTGSEPNDPFTGTKRPYTDHVPGRQRRPSPATIDTSSTSSSSSSNQEIITAPSSNNNDTHNHKRAKIAGSGNPYVKSTWTEQEDEFLIRAVTSSSEQPFTRWSDLSTHLPGRVGKQIRDRWLNHLDPKIDRSPFSRDDDLKLYQAFKKHGKRWVEISTKYFDSRRSENHIKNRFYSAAFKKFVKTEFGEDHVPSAPAAAASTTKSPSSSPERQHQRASSADVVELNKRDDGVSEE